VIAYFNIGSLKKVILVLITKQAINDREIYRRMKTTEKIAY
jgi:hypothetical protein